MKKHSLIFAIFIWSLAIFFFAYESFLRIFLGTVAPEFMDELRLTTQQFSIIGSTYFIIYGMMQIPVGVLTEKIGTRTVLGSASFICTIGALGLAYAHGFYSVLLNRFIMGFGSSFSFVALLILALNWFPRSYFGFLSGVALFLGSLGPFLAGAPLAYLSERTGGNWRLILLWAVLVGLVLSLSLALFVRNKPKECEQRIIFLSPHEPLRQKLAMLLKNPQAWYIILSGGLLYVSLPLLGAFWGTTYLQAKGFEKTAAAFIISMIWIGFAVGSPLIGKLSDQTKRRVPFILAGSLLGVAASSAILYTTANYATLMILFFLVGFASSAQAITYALIIEHTPTKLHPAALGLNSTAVMLFGAIIPLITGAMIQSSLIATGFVTLKERNFVGGLSLIPLAYMATAFISWIGIKETFCRPQHEIHKLQSFHKASDLL